MTPQEFKAARYALGVQWRGKPFSMADFGRLLRLQGRDPGQTIHNWETGKVPVSGPVSLAIDLLLTGAIPPEGFPEGPGSNKRIDD